MLPSPIQQLLLTRDFLTATGGFQTLLQIRMAVLPISKGAPGTMHVVCIHYSYSNPHPPQMGRVWIENNYLLKK
jgi:hypothetical protein